MISLSNLSDDRMRHAKSGEWWDDPDNNIFQSKAIAAWQITQLRILKSRMLCLLRVDCIAESGSGERGIFNRQAATKQVAQNGRRDPNYEWELIHVRKLFCATLRSILRRVSLLQELADSFVIFRK